MLIKEVTESSTLPTLSVIYSIATWWLSQHRGCFWIWWRTHLPLSSLPFGDFHCRDITKFVWSTKCMIITWSPVIPQMKPSNQPSLLLYIQVFEKYISLLLYYCQLIPYLSCASSGCHPLLCPHLPFHHIFPPCLSQINWSNLSWSALCGRNSWLIYISQKMLAIHEWKTVRNRA